MASSKCDVVIRMCEDLKWVIIQVWELNHRLIISDFKQERVSVFLFAFAFRVNIDVSEAAEDASFNGFDYGQSRPLIVAFFVKMGLTGAISRSSVDGSFDFQVPTKGQGVFKDFLIL